MTRDTTCAVVSAAKGSAVGAGMRCFSANARSSATGSHTASLYWSTKARSAATLSPSRGTGGPGTAAAMRRRRSGYCLWRDTRAAASSPTTRLCRPSATHARRTSGLVRVSGKHESALRVGLPPQCDGRHFSSRWRCRARRCSCRRRAPALRRWSRRGGGGRVPFQRGFAEKCVPGTLRCRQERPSAAAGRRCERRRGHGCTTSQAQRAGDSRHALLTASRLPPVVARGHAATFWSVMSARHAAGDGAPRPHISHISR